MSAVGDSRTSKYRTSHIKQATLIPALLLRSGEGASEEPPNSPPLSSPAHPGPGLKLSLSLFLVFWCPENRQSTGATGRSLAAHFTEQSASWEQSTAGTAAHTDLLSDSPRNNKINTHTHAHANKHRKCNVMSKQLEYDGHWAYWH